MSSRTPKQVVLTLAGIMLCTGVYADTAALQKTLSANESYLKRFRTEQASLLKQPPDADTHKKLEKLKHKIRVLENEIARLKPAAERDPFKPAAKAEEAPSRMPLLQTQWVDTFEARREPEMQAPADEDVYYLGSDWEQMSVRDKERYIELANSQLARAGVLVTRHVFFYQMELDKVLMQKPELRSKKLDNLFMAQVYRHEEPNRSRIQAFRAEVLVGHS